MEDLLKLENQICFPAYAFSRNLTNLYRPLLAQLDITYPQYLVLMVLWEHKEQSVNQLCEKLYLDTGTLTPLLKRLEQKALLNRTRSKQDERMVMISLTATGIQLKEKAKHIPMELVKCMNVSIDELLQLKGLLNKVLNK
ncbi:MarR family winged helix-turn-helix transcriptional regulator [Mucilaginibacter sp. KACC 22063]|uniref:MarR family winged helix-turn-helix transcriptional regulator n=1 Tax=Mucilaginibacter sp. KACC 22063 TaxID=3025666 RepID=UPI002366E456|nr:MarR family transcriptional regulator [Mucilaginibacter sp. KACC 22063]WDF54214.1 MarR family transcriptional regulator [Mucilaginibacter sp. KACC 22063]